MTPKAKIAVTLPQDLVAQARDAVSDGRATSVRRTHGHGILTSDPEDLRTLDPRIILTVV